MKITKGDIFWFMGSRYMQAQKGTIGAVLTNGQGERLIDVHLEDGTLIKHVHERNFVGESVKFVPFEDYLKYKMRVLTCHRPRKVIKPT